MEQRRGQKGKKRRGAIACVTCRRLKVRCVPLRPEKANSDGVSPPCQRCARLGYDCRFDSLPRGMWRQHSARYLRQGDRQQLHKSPTEAHETDEEERDWLQARVDEATTQLEEFISGRQKKKKQDFKDKTNNKGGTIGQGTTQTLPVSFTSPSTSKSTDLPRKSKGGKYASERYLGPVGRMDSLEVLVDPFPSSETEEDATAYDNEGRKGQVESKGKGRESKASTTPATSSTFSAIRTSSKRFVRPKPGAAPFVSCSHP